MPFQLGNRQDSDLPYKGKHWVGAIQDSKKRKRENNDYGHMHSFSLKMLLLDKGVESVQLSSGVQTVVFKCDSDSSRSLS